MPQFPPSLKDFFFIKSNKISANFPLPSFLTLKNLRQRRPMNIWLSGSKFQPFASISGEIQHKTIVPIYILRNVKA